MLTAHTTERLTPAEAVQRAESDLLQSSVVSVAIDEANIAGFHTHYLAAGEGSPLILLQGAAGGAATWWSTTIGPLAQAGYRVIAPDLPGFGLSQKVSWSGRQVIAEVVNWLQELLDFLSIKKATFIGLSLGGLFTLSLYKAHPERIARMVLVDAAGLGREQPLAYRLMGVPVVKHIINATLLRSTRFHTRMFFKQLLVYNLNAVDKRVLEHVYTVSALPDYRLTLLTGADQVLDIRGTRPELIYTDLLPNIKVPTLIVWGDQDRWFPLNHGRLAVKQISNATLYVMQDCGHCPMLERPAEFNQTVLNFMGRTQRG